MEKEKNEGSITDNKEVDKRVLVVGKLKGTKPPKKKAGFQNPYHHHLL